MAPVVSIIIPTHNSDATLEDCLQSIVQQTYPRKEVVVMDGLSNDNTVSVLQKYKDEYPFITYVSEKDNGIYDAMNKGIDKANGEYLLFLGSDDKLYSKTVLAEIFSDGKTEDADLIYGNVLFKHAQKVYSGKSSLEKLIGEQISICHQAIFYKKEIFTRIGKYDLKYFVHADYDLNVKCFEDTTIKKKYADKIITLYNERGLSGLQPNKDGFHDWLTLHYITKYTSPFDFFSKTKNLKAELEGIENSKAYKIARVLSKGWTKTKAIKRFLFSSARNKRTQ